MYRVEVDFAPAHELSLSLFAYVNVTDQVSMELGRGWARQVARQLSPDLVAELAVEEMTHGVDLMGLLASFCPGRRDACGFLEWLAGLSTGDLYELLAPHAVEPLPRDLAGFRDRFVRLLSGWNEQYFRHIDPAILAGLEADAAAKRALLDTMEPVELVELATQGVVYTPPDSIELVTLIPQYHHRPWNIHTYIRGARRYSYPADVVTPPPGDPPPALKRLARALGDESRLRILHAVAQEPRTFTDLVRLTGLAKSTVNHHTVALRAAGLFRVHDTGDKRNVTYSLRPGAEDRLSAELGAYLRGS